MTDHPMTDHPPATKNTPLDRHLLEMLVCPVSLGPLRYDREAGELISEKTGLAFPIRQGIPVMLEQAARLVEE